MTYIQKHTKKLYIKRFALNNSITLNSRQCRPDYLAYDLLFPHDNYSNPCNTKNLKLYDSNFKEKESKTSHIPCSIKNIKITKIFNSAAIKNAPSFRLFWYTTQCAHITRQSNTFSQNAPP